MAFKIAGAMALRKGVAAARPILLEPIAAVEVMVPEDYLGAVLGDLTSRRGRVTGMDKAGKTEVVRALVPAAALDSYAVELRSLSKGSGSFSLHHAHYDETPPDIAHQLIDQYQKTVRHDDEK
jgi:elongation factor G